MKSAKCVSGTDVSTMSDTQGNLLDNQQITRYGAAVQGNATSPRGSMKSHHRSRENSRVGGTLNDTAAMFAPAKAKLCRVITRQVDTHTWEAGRMVRTNTKPSVSYTVQSDVIPTLAFIIKRATKMDISIVEYCELNNIDMSKVTD